MGFQSHKNNIMYDYKLMSKRCFEAKRQPSHIFTLFVLCMMFSICISVYCRYSYSIFSINIHILLTFDENDNYSLDWQYLLKKWPIRFWHQYILFVYSFNLIYIFYIFNIYCSLIINLIHIKFKCYDFNTYLNFS